ncbi:MAG: MMPL family transporter [bacterium]
MKFETKRTDDFKSSLANAMCSTGRPIIFTSVVLSLGFLVLVLASFNPLVHFGILLFILILLALVFDLIVLPAMMGFVGSRSGNQQ